MKNHKAPGQDTITTEMIKAGDQTAISLLEILFHIIWNEQEVPSDWKQSIIIPLHKKGPKTKCENFRGISLISVPAKILSRIIYNRLYPHINALLCDTQCGFRNGKSTIDMVFTTRQTIEKAIEQ
jgi:Reverse transcriptase (RNA-dependent DNA polymerase).